MQGWPSMLLPSVSVRSWLRERCSSALGQDLLSGLAELAGGRDVAIESLAGNSQFLAQSPDMSVILSHRRHCESNFGRCHLVGPPAFASTRSGRSQAGDGAFGNQFTFKLCQRGEDPQHELARGRGRC